MKKCIYLSVTIRSTDGWDPVLVTETDPDLRILLPVKKRSPAPFVLYPMFSALGLDPVPVDEAELNPRAKRCSLPESQEPSQPMVRQRFSRSPQRRRSSESVKTLSGMIILRETGLSSSEEGAGMGRGRTSARLDVLSCCLMLLSSLLHPGNSSTRLERGRLSTACNVQGSSQDLALGQRLVMLERSRGFAVISKGQCYQFPDRWADLCLCQELLCVFGVHA